MWFLSLVVLQLAGFLEAFAAKNFDEVLPVLVQQVCRHGDRAPYSFFPNNQNKDFWVQGEGYLTPVGENELYTNGGAFRDSWYPGLLDEVVYPTEAFVISSHVHRTIMSANSFMAGLYPPTKEFMFEKGLNWQAFPTHSISPSVDYYLYGTDCPAWDDALDRIYSSPDYLKFLEENQAFINSTCQNAGYDESQFNVNSLADLDDNLICDDIHGLPLPGWATPELRTRMANILNIRRNFEFSNPDAAFLDTGGGPVLGLMVQNIQKKMSGSLTQKFIYYSAHDTTVLPFLGNLDQPVGPNPPYASCGVLELYQDGDSDFYVQLVFRNSTLGMSTDARVMPFPCSQTYCEYPDFIKMAATRANMEPAKACLRPSSKNQNEM